MSHSSIFMINSPEYLEDRLKYYNCDYEANEEPLLTFDSEEFVDEVRKVHEEDFYDNGFLNDGWHDCVSNREREEVLEDFQTLAEYGEDIWSVYEYSTGKFMIKFYREGVLKYVNKVAEEIKQAVDNYTNKGGSYYQIEKATNGDRGGWYFYEDNSTYYTERQWLVQLADYFRHWPDKDYFVYYLDDALDYHC